MKNELFFTQLRKLVKTSEAYVIERPLSSIN